jgi:hypothetical protein
VLFPRFTPVLGEFSGTFIPEKLIILYDREEATKREGAINERKDERGKRCT